MKCVVFLVLVAACGTSSATLIDTQCPSGVGVRSTVAIPPTGQPAELMTPSEEITPNCPLVVSLHTWSGNYSQRWPELEGEAMARGWLYLHPDFQGPNFTADACGSLRAQQDILDAVRWAIDSLHVDPNRVYLVGLSGGGHMALLMAGRHPKVWAGVSAWVGISDLWAWRNEVSSVDYHPSLDICTGGSQAEYVARSPLTWLANATSVPVDIAAGISDGHRGSVPIHHSLRAFNAIATAIHAPAIHESEITALSVSPTARLAHPSAADTLSDSTYGRAIILRRYARRSRVTIFEGGHEGIASAAVAFLQPLRRH